MKNAAIRYITSIVFMIFIVVIAPVLVLSKLVDAPMPTKRTEFGDALDFKKSLAFSLLVWVVIFWSV